MNTPLSTKAVANYFIVKMKERGLDVSPMKLQKLVYYAHGWHLALGDGSPLIPETVQAWQYGPVVESLYHDVKYWGHRSITEAIGETFFDAQTGSLRLTAPIVEDESIKGLLDEIIRIYGNFDAVQLSNMTHMPGTPWDSIRAKFPEELGHRSVTIPNDLIKDHFLKVKQTAGA